MFAVGDIAWITDTKSKDVLPQLGSVALQAGEHAGENIALRVAGKETKPFGYFDKGTMATIGHGSAVIQLPRGRTLKGRAAWLAWRVRRWVVCDVMLASTSQWDGAKGVGASFSRRAPLL